MLCFEPVSTNSSLPNPIPPPSPCALPLPPHTQVAVLTGWLTNTTTNPAGSGSLADMKVVLCSSMGTTLPNPPPYAGGPVLFYKLQAEAFLGSAGITTSVVKPCGLMVGVGWTAHIRICTACAKPGWESALVGGRSDTDLAVPVERTHPFV